MWSSISLGCGLNLIHPCAIKTLILFNSSILVNDVTVKSSFGGFAPSLMRLADPRIMQDLSSATYSACASYKASSVTQ
jgi:hypothetical protein